MRINSAHYYKKLSWRRANPGAISRGMGNRLRHAYDRIDLDVLWNTIRDRLPSLKEDVEQAPLGLEAKGDRDDGGK